MLIEDMYSVLPKMRLPDEGGAEFDPHVTADGESSVIVWLDVEFD